MGRKTTVKKKTTWGKRNIWSGKRKDIHQKQFLTSRKCNGTETRYPAENFWASRGMMALFKGAGEV